MPPPPGFSPTDGIWIRIKPPSSRPDEPERPKYYKHSPDGEVTP